MSLVSGGLIEIADYNELALEVNRIFSDNVASRAWATSQLVLNDAASGSGEAAGATRQLSPAPIASDFLVVTINNITQVNMSDYTVSYTNPVTITFLDPLAASAQLRVYNRQTHRYGWGQLASVYPVDAGDPILADESTLQAYLEANINNLIDKVNIMEDRVDGPSELTRIATGKIIEFTDKTLIQTTIDTDILANDNEWSNELATAVGQAESFTRTADWNNTLIGVMRYSWTSYDRMRYFLNSGGELRASVVMTGNNSNQAFSNWNQVATTMGTLRLNYNTAFQSGTNGVSSNLGAYALTTEWQTIFTSGSPPTPFADNGDFDEYGDFDDYGTYTNLTMNWQARIVDNAPLTGNISLDIRVTLNDLDLNETFVGTTTYRGGYLLADPVSKSSAVFSMVANTPTLAVETSFTDSDLVVETDYTIVSVAQTNPVVVTVSPNIGVLQTGNKIVIRGVVGMTELNGNCYTITMIDNQSFRLNNINGTGFTAYSSGGVASRQEWFSWAAIGPAGTSFAAAFTQDVGYTDVNVTTEILSSSATALVSNDTIHVAAGECFNINSSGRLEAGSVVGNQVRVTLTFNPSAGADANANVENVRFRVSDIELSGRNEQVTVTATNSSAAGQTVTHQLGNRLQLSGSTVSANTVAITSPNDVRNSALFTIAGPVQTVVILFTEPEQHTGSVWISDIYFEPQPA